MTVCILGAGSWGTALGLLLARNAVTTVLIARTAAEAETLGRDRENRRYLPGFPFPTSLEVSDAARPADLAVIAVPSGGVRAVLSGLRTSRILVASKGLEPESGLLMSEVSREQCPGVEVGVLSGPNLAVEVANGIPTLAISAFGNLDTARGIGELFRQATFRVSASDDVVGVELGGALKNVLALGAGMSDGLGFGDNTKGAFLSRGLMEIARLGMAMGGRLETFLGPAGVGDLFATAASGLSRNYRVGRGLGEGQSLEDALRVVGQTAEGVPTSHAVQRLAEKHGVEMPVFLAVEQVLVGEISATEAVGRLMSR